MKIKLLKPQSTDAGTYTGLPEDEIQWGEVVSENKRHKRRKEDAFYKWLDDTVTKVSGNIELGLTFAILWAYIVLSFLTYANWEKFL